MSLIDPRAIIDPSAQLADDVTVGPGQLLDLGLQLAQDQSLHRML